MDVNTQCPGCAAPVSYLIRDGFYHRADDSKSIQRFRCKKCDKKCSSATFKPTYRQKKRRIKKTRYDPLFSVNHSFATIRAKVNRLNRRTWCTTKNPARLADHIDIFIDVFSDRLKLLCLSPQALQRRAARGEK